MRSKVLTHPALARDQFRRLVSSSSSGLPVSRAALVVALERYPSIDVDGYVAIIRGWAERVVARTSGSRDIERQIDAVNDLLYGEEGFHAEESYYDPRNTFLNDVLDRHGGLPIALSILYIELTRNLGIDSTGVAMPGTMLVRLSGPWGDLIIDPFDQGRVLDRAECEEMVARTFGGAIQLREDHLRSYSDRELISKLLTHIKAIHLADQDVASAISALDRLLILGELDAWDRRERGLLHLREHNYEDAITDLEYYLEHTPHADDFDRIRSEIESLRSWLSP